MYHSTNPTTKSKGVSILLFSKAPWKYQDSIKDPAGRYVFLKGLIGDIQVTLATIYTPNDRQDAFLNHTLEKLLEFTEGQLILGGDFNVPLLPSVDTSSGSSSVPPCPLKQIANSIKLIDIWKFQQSGEGDYVFYSAPHKIYTRIDYFLIPHAQLHAVSDPSIGHITWSDHTPISLTYTLSRASSPRHCFWLLNESLLQVPEVLADVSKELHFYFQTNNYHDCDPDSLWEAHKKQSLEVYSLSTVHESNGNVMNNSLGSLNCQLPNLATNTLPLLLRRLNLSCYAYRSPTYYTTRLRRHYNFDVKQTMSLETNAVNC